MTDGAKTSIINKQTNVIIELEIINLFCSENKNAPIIKPVINNDVNTKAIICPFEHFFTSFTFFPPKVI